MSGLHNLVKSQLDPTDDPNEWVKGPDGFEKIAFPQSLDREGEHFDQKPEEIVTGISQNYGPSGERRG